MKKTIFIILLSFNSLFAQENFFTKGNELYANQDYNNAIIYYDSILEMGIENWKIYYNLGNCHYKQNNIANAIWHYEKSLKHKKNKKTQYNLDLAKLKTVDKITILPQLFYEKWWHSIIELFNTKTWQITTLILIWLLLIYKSIDIYFYKLNKLILNTILFLSVLCCLVSFSSYKKTIKKEGIIFSSSITVYSAPTEKSTNLFSIHEGLKVQKNDQIGDWINIKLENGNSGWIKENNYKSL